MDDEPAKSQPYGFPDDWFYSVEISPHFVKRGIRCFPPPEPSKLPAERLKDYSLFQRLILSLRDFSHARSAITFVREEVDFKAKYGRAELRRFQCYETTLIVSYCRPFSESRGGIPQLSYKILGIRLSHFVRLLHDSLMAKRNKIFAHSDAEHVEYSGPVVTHLNDHTGRPLSVLYPPDFHEGMLLTEAEFEQVSVLVNDVWYAVNRMVQAMHRNFVDQLPSVDLDLE